MQAGTDLEKPGLKDIAKKLVERGKLIKTNNCNVSF